MGQRLEGRPGFGIDRVAEAAGSDPEMLRLENYDTDIPPHPDAVEATRAAIGRDEANSYLPFSGLDEMKEAVAELIARCGGPKYDPYTEIVITDGDGSAVLNALLVLTDPEDEVILTDPTYAGMLQRVRLVGAVPRFRARRMVRAVRRRSMRARCVRALAGVARAKVAATPMTDAWGGAVATRYVRLVFSNEPVERSHCWASDCAPRSPENGARRPPGASPDLNLLRCKARVRVPSLPPSGRTRSAVSTIRRCVARSSPLTERRSAGSLPETGVKGAIIRVTPQAAARIRNRRRCSAKSRPRLRACWVTQSPLGFFVQPASQTRRLACAMKNNT